MNGLENGGGRRRCTPPVEFTSKMETIPPKAVAGSELHVFPMGAPYRPHDVGTAPKRSQAGGATMTGMILVLYMLVSMSLTLLDKYIITGLAFNTPLTMIALTYFIMHVMSIGLRTMLRHQAKPGAEPLLQRLSLVEWSWKVLPVAAASGLEVGTSTLGLQVMHVGLHTMIRSTIPIFVLLFSVGLGLQQFHFSLLVVVFLVSGGVAMLFSGESSDRSEQYPIEGFLLTLLSGMLAGLKWTMSQVFLQGRGLCGKGGQVVEEPIHPVALVHYMSLSSAAILVPFVLGLELGKLQVMTETFTTERILHTMGLIFVASVLALKLVLLEFFFIKRVSSLSLCIIGVVKELLLVLFSVGFLEETISPRTGVGFAVTMVGVALYKLVPTDTPPAAATRYAAVPRAGDGASSGNIGGGAESSCVYLLPPKEELSTDSQLSLVEVLVGGGIEVKATKAEPNSSAAAAVVCR